MIMKLTGKAKEDFINFRLDKFSHVEFIDLPILLQNALIIEWFDSVGIYIEIECCMCDSDYGFESGIYFDNYKDYVNAVYFTKTRQQATEKAIINANKIYNENIRRTNTSRVL